MELELDAPISLGFCLLGKRDIDAGTCRKRGALSWSWRERSGKKSVEAVACPWFASKTHLVKMPFLAKAVRYSVEFLF